MSSDLVTVFGGSGFIGKQVVRALAKQGRRVRIAMRRPHLGHELRVMGDVGQVQLVQANVRFPESVDAALEDAGAVVNLVAVLYERGKQSFDALHIDAARTIAEAAAKRGITRMAHFSALGAAPKGSKYVRSKYAGERAVLEALPTATILRPSIVFGPEDNFFNRFAGMVQRRASVPFPLNVLPLPGNKTKLQPVFVGDVAEAVSAAIADPNAQGRIYELGGPHTYTFRQLIDYVRAETDRDVPVLPLASYVAHPAGVLANAAFSLLPWAPPLTGDQVMTLKRDNVVGANPSALTIQDLGVTQLESVEAIVPNYLWRFRPYGQFQTKQNPV